MGSFFFFFVSIIFGIFVVCQSFYNTFYNLIKNKVEKWEFLYVQKLIQFSVLLLFYLFCASSLSRSTSYPQWRIYKFGVMAKLFVVNMPNFYSSSINEIMSDDGIYKGCRKPFGY